MILFIAVEWLASIAAGTKTSLGVRLAFWGAYLALRTVISATRRRPEAPKTH